MTESVSTPFRLRIVAPGAGTPPSWALAQPIGRWYTVPNTAQSLVREPDTIASAPSGQGWQSGNVTARLNAWCGPSLRKRSSVLILGPTGGHGDYYGNWLSQVILGSETPFVEILDAGTHWRSMYANSSYHADLRPVATHSYYSHVFCDQRDWMMYFAVTGHSGDGVPGGADFPGALPPADWPYSAAAGYAARRVAVYDYASRQWRPPGTVTDQLTVGQDNFTAAPYAVHPSTGDVYYGRDGDANGGLYVWQQSTNSHRMIARSYPVNYQAVAIDSRRNRIFFSGGPDSLPMAYRPRLFDCDTGVASAVTLVGPSAEIVKQDATGYSNPAYPGMVYIPRLDRFLFAINNTVRGRVELHEIESETFYSQPYASSGAEPIAAINGIETKLQFAPELNGLVLMNSYNEGVKYLRLY